MYFQERQPFQFGMCGGMEKGIRPVSIGVHQKCAGSEHVDILVMLHELILFREPVRQIDIIGVRSGNQIRAREADRFIEARRQLHVRGVAVKLYAAILRRVFSDDVCSCIRRTVIDDD